MCYNYFSVGVTQGEISLIQKICSSATDFINRLIFISSLILFVKLGKISPVNNNYWYIKIFFKFSFH